MKKEWKARSGARIILECEKERIELWFAGGAGNEEEYEQIVEALRKKCPYKVTF